MSDELKNLDTHFAFGENWEKYSRLINEDRIEEAKRSLTELLDIDGKEMSLEGKSFLDIGCGSGLFSLAASKLGATDITLTDIDPISVKTAQAVLKRFDSKAKVTSDVISVFDLNPDAHGRFDVVYSWGVLHHTGDMYGAIKKASDMVKQDGVFIIALYQKTKCCQVWKHIKRVYKSLPSILQKCVQVLQVLGVSVKLLFKATNPFKYIKDYKKSRGMSYLHDVHDWLGGYPYESIALEEMKKFANEIGFKILKTRNIENRQPIGFFGSGCGEFVMVRST